MKIFLTVLAMAQSLAAQGTCKIPLDAEMKAFESPVHMYISSNVGGKSIAAESIFVGGNSYIKVNGTWMTSGKTSDYTGLVQKKRQQHSNAVCSYVKDEVVDGEMTALYTLSSVLASGGKYSSHIWISKSRGVPVRQEDDVETARGKTHNSSRYEYSNVKPPM